MKGGLKFRNPNFLNPAWAVTKVKVPFRYHGHLLEIKAVDLDYPVSFYHVRKEANMHVGVMAKLGVPRVSESDVVSCICCYVHLRIYWTSTTIILEPLHPPNPLFPHVARTTHRHHLSLIPFIYGPLMCSAQETS